MCKIKQVGKTEKAQEIKKKRRKGQGKVHVQERETMYNRGRACDREDKHSCEKKEMVHKKEGNNMQERGEEHTKKLHKQESTRKGKHVRKGKSMCKTGRFEQGEKSA